MMVIFVSQCEKKALNRTRRVLDSFADRIGDNIWQTVITEDGLIAVKRMLRKTASKSTAVSCHWIRGRSRRELLWVVGNRSKFDNRGCVAVNSTEKALEQFYDSEAWHTLAVIKYASVIAGLFHDFGKANVLFQAKLNPNKKSNKFEPYRHEWLSLRLFQAFVGNKNDSEWLDVLANNTLASDFEAVFCDGINGNVSLNHPLLNLPPLAQLVAWLILSHHKLPLVPAWKEGIVASAKFVGIKQWFENNFDALWNSYNCKEAEQQQFVIENWNVKHALPVQSMQWRSNASIIASKAKTVLRPYMIESTDWLNHQLFTTHMARLCLMMADHHYSALGKVTDEWRNPHYEVYANTKRDTNQLNQKLDEHLIGVAQHAQRITNALPKLNRTLSQLAENVYLSKKVEKAHKETFGWQDEAKKLAHQVGKDTVKKGFLGINMASTGRGKTLANAKIMYALGKEAGRKRFSVALGLRTLTLQTGREFREKLNLNDEQLAIAVGGIAVKQLFENAQSKITEDDQKQLIGSESQDDFLDPDLLVDYRGSLSDHSLSEWTKNNSRLQKLLDAPILTCTIDHLIPACEGTKGGKQIGPMLRLLTSDLVLDEPDDFGLEDLPALCRLVHWAAMLGSRVLLSTATMPPALTFALFQAYAAGWKEYAKANIQNYDDQIMCAWFDEFGSQGGLFNTYESYKIAHNSFVRNRVKALYKQMKTFKPKQLGQIIPVDFQNNNSIAANLAQTIRTNLIKLHLDHQQCHEGKAISIGLVRMANINPLIAIAKELIKHDAPEDTCIHYCIYHSRYPLAVRSYIEEQLDKVLLRKDPQAIFKHEIINKILSNHSQKNHIFVVLASPVAEVGRDHDYDWAIIEPSSMRSIIQIAGRVLRHRNKIPKKPNIQLLNKNYKALAGKKTCFERPGFESKELALLQHDLTSILDPLQYEQISAIERINLPAECRTKNGGKYLNLIELEHKALARQLFSGDDPAKVWWENTPHWCGEVQRQQRFRNSKKDEAYYLWLKDEFSSPSWKWKNEHVHPAKFGEALVKINIINDNDISKGARCQFWFDLSALNIYSRLATNFNLDLKEVSMRFGEVRIVEYDTNQKEYNYHPNFGIYKEIGE